MKTGKTPEYLKSLIDDRPDEGVFRIHRDVFTDPDIFALEMKHLFEGGWVFLGLGSQIPNKHDFITTRIGRQPLLITRDKTGTIRALINSCPHKGARVCPLRQGSARVHVCPYHSWSFDSAGKNVMVKARSVGNYAPAFDHDSHDLDEIPRLENYGGFLFGSLVGDVMPLEQYLGEARKLIDLITQQSPDGVELVPGSTSFTYDANWKLQLENCSDQYHFSSVHPSYVKLLERRAEAQWSGAVRNMWDAEKVTNEADAGAGGSYIFDEGHVLNWRAVDNADAMPLYEQIPAIVARVGQAKADWMMHARNLTIFPNLQVAENASSQLRIIRPIAVNRTEMQTFCIAPIGESAAARRTRIRQYEDFFNPSGLATPDDAVVYEACQEGFGGEANPWLQGYARGIAANRPGGDRYSDMIGLVPDRSIGGNRHMGDETIFHAYYRAWLRRLSDGLALDHNDAVGVR